MTVPASPQQAPRPTQAQAVTAAGASIAEAYRLLDTLPVAEAARIAHTPTGPSIPELEARIRARRTSTTDTLAVAS